jgi:hypothetical protein
MTAPVPSPAHGRKPGRSSATIAAALLLAAALSPLAARGQSLAETAQKEKERREAVTAGKAVVVTNADLSKVKKKSAVALPAAPQPAAGTESQAPTGAAAGTAAPPRTETAADLAAARAAAPTRAEMDAAGAAARAAEIPASALEGNPRAVFDQKKVDLEGQWNAARERTGLLEVKLLGLQQQSLRAVNADARDAVAKDIESATRTLAGARLEEMKAKAELEKFLAGASEVKK